MIRTLVYISGLVLLSACDRFVIYHLRVTGPGKQAISQAEITEDESGYPGYTDSLGHIELNKVTEGIRPNLVKKVSIHKEGYRDTLVYLNPDAETIIQISPLSR